MSSKHLIDMNGPFSTLITLNDKDISHPVQLPQSFTPKSSKHGHAVGQHVTSSQPFQINFTSMDHIPKNGTPPDLALVAYFPIQCTPSMPFITIHDMDFYMPPPIITITNIELLAVTTNECVRGISNKHYIITTLEPSRLLPTIKSYKSHTRPYDKSKNNNNHNHHHHHHHDDNIYDLPSLVHITDGVAIIPLDLNRIIPNPNQKFQNVDKNNQNFNNKKITPCQIIYCPRQGEVSTFDNLCLANNALNESTTSPALSIICSHQLAYQYLPQWIEYALEYYLHTRFDGALHCKCDIDYTSNTLMINLTFNNGCQRHEQNPYKYDITLRGPIIEFFSGRSDLSMSPETPVKVYMQQRAAMHVSLTGKMLRECTSLDDFDKALQSMMGLVYIDNIDNIYNIPTHNGNVCLNGQTNTTTTTQHYGNGQTTSVNHTTGCVKVETYKLLLCESNAMLPPSPSALSDLTKDDINSETNSDTSSDGHNNHPTAPIHANRSTKKIQSDTSTTTLREQDLNKPSNILGSVGVLYNKANTSSTQYTQKHTGNHTINFSCGMVVNQQRFWDTIQSQIAPDLTTDFYSIDNSSTSDHLNNMNHQKQSKSSVQQYCVALSLPENSNNNFTLRDVHVPHSRSNNFNTCVDCEYSSISQSLPSKDHNGMNTSYKWTLYKTLFGNVKSITVTAGKTTIVTISAHDTSYISPTVWSRTIKSSDLATLHTTNCITTSKHMPYSKIKSKNNKYIDIKGLSNGAIKGVKNTQLHYHYQPYSLHASIPIPTTRSSTLSSTALTSDTITFDQKYKNKHTSVMTMTTSPLSDLLYVDSNGRFSAPGVLLSGPSTWMDDNENCEDSNQNNNIDMKTCNPSDSDNNHYHDDDNKNIKRCIHGDYNSDKMDTVKMVTNIGTIGLIPSEYNMQRQLEWTVPYNMFCTHTQKQSDDDEANKMHVPTHVDNDCYNSDANVHRQPCVTTIGRMLTKNRISQPAALILSENRYALHGAWMCTKNKRMSVTLLLDNRITEQEDTNNSCQINNNMHDYNTNTSLRGNIIPVGMGKTEIQFVNELGWPLYFENVKTSLCIKGSIK